MGNQHPQGNPIRLFRAITSMIVTAFLFAFALSVLIVLLWKGLPILQHGIPMCGLLIQENMLDKILYTSCGCALVEIVALPICFFGVVIFGPKLWRKTQALRPQTQHLKQDSQQDAIDSGES